MTDLRELEVSTEQFTPDPIDGLIVCFRGRIPIAAILIKDLSALNVQDFQNSAAGTAREVRAIMAKHNATSVSFFDAEEARRIAEDDGRLRTDPNLWYHLIPSGVSIPVSRYTLTLPIQRIGIPSTDTRAHTLVADQNFDALIQALGFTEIPIP